MSKKGLSVVSGSSDVKHKMLNDGDAVLGITTAISTVSGTLNVLSETSGNLATRINDTSGSFSGDASTSLATSSSLSGEIDNTSVSQVGDTSRVHTAAAGTYIVGSVSLTASDILIDDQLSASRDDITLVTADASTQGSVAYAIDQYLKGNGLAGTLNTVEALSSSIEIANLSSSVSSALETMRVEITGATATTETLKEIDDSIHDHVSGAITGALAQDTALIGIVDNASASIGLDEVAGARTLSYSGTEYIDSHNNLADAASTLEAQQVTNSGTLAGLTGTLATSAQLTVAGDATLTGDVSVTSSFQVPHYSSIPAELLDLTGALIANMAPYEGDIFYLTTADTVAPFTMGGKFYFCENGKWHRSPFFSDLDGDGTPDQLDSLPTVPNGTLSSTSGGTLTVQPGGESITLQQGTTVLDSSGSAYTGDLTLEVREATDSNVTNYAVLSQGGAVSSVLVFGPAGTTFSPALSVTIPLSSVPSDPNDLAIAYDDGNGWTQTVSVSAGTLTYNAGTNSVTFEVSSFSSVSAINKLEAAQSITFVEQAAGFNYTGLKVSETTGWFSENTLIVSSSLGQHTFNAASGGGTHPLFGPNTGVASAEIDLSSFLPELGFVEGVEYTITSYDSWGDGQVRFTFRDPLGVAHAVPKTISNYHSNMLKIKWENSKLHVTSLNSTGQTSQGYVLGYNSNTARWETIDTDGDTYADWIDDFPNDSAAYSDNDFDGQPDILLGASLTGLIEDTDDDGDGILDVNDPQPYDPGQRHDTRAFNLAFFRAPGINEGVSLSASSEATDGFFQYDSYSSLVSTSRDDYYGRYYYFKDSAPNAQNQQTFPTTEQEFAAFSSTGNEWTSPPLVNRNSGYSHLFYELPDDGTKYNFLLKTTGSFQDIHIWYGADPVTREYKATNKIDIAAVAGTGSGYGVAVQTWMTNGVFQYRYGDLDSTQNIGNVANWSADLYGDTDADGVLDNAEADLQSIYEPPTSWPQSDFGVNPYLTNDTQLDPILYVRSNAPYGATGTEPVTNSGVTLTYNLQSQTDSLGNPVSLFTIDSGTGVVSWAGGIAANDGDYLLTVAVTGTQPPESYASDYAFATTVTSSVLSFIDLNENGANDPNDVSDINSQGAGSTTLTFTQQDGNNGGSGYNMVAVDAVGSIETINGSIFATTQIDGGAYTFGAGYLMPNGGKTFTTSLSHATSSINGTDMAVIVTLKMASSSLANFRTPTFVEFTDSSGVSKTIELSWPVVTDPDKRFKIQRNSSTGVIHVYEDNFGSWNELFPPNSVPVITLLGASTVNLVTGQAYTDAGATAFDAEDGDITANIVPGGSVNTGSAGTYTLTYDVTDSNGAAAVQVTRTVNVYTNLAPSITLTGDSTVYIAQNDTYTEQGATAFDPNDGDVTANVTISGSVDTSTTGSYTLVYEIVDPGGLSASTTRTVEVLTSLLDTDGDGTPDEVDTDDDDDGILDVNDPAPLDDTLPSAPILYDWSPLSLTTSGSSGVYDGYGSTPDHYNSLVPMISGDSVVLSSTTSPVTAKSRATVQIPVTGFVSSSDGDTLTFFDRNNTQYVITARTSPSSAGEFLIHNDAYQHASAIRAAILSIASASVYVPEARQGYTRTTDQTNSDPQTEVLALEIVQELSGGAGKSISTTMSNVNLEQNSFTMDTVYLLPGISGDANSTNGMEVNYRLDHIQQSTTTILTSSGWQSLSQDWTYSVPNYTSSDDVSIEIRADFRNQYGQEEWQNDGNSDRMTIGGTSAGPSLFVASSQASYEFAANDGTYDHSIADAMWLNDTFNWVVTDVSGNVRDLSTSATGSGDFRYHTLNSVMQSEYATPDAGGNALYVGTVLFCVEGDTIVMSATGETNNTVLKNGSVSTDVQHAFKADKNETLSWGSQELYDTTNSWTVGSTTYEETYEGSGVFNTFNGGNNLARIYTESGWKNFVDQQPIDGGLNTTGYGPEIVVFKTQQYYDNAKANWFASGSIFGALSVDD